MNLPAIISFLQSNSGAMLGSVAATIALASAASKGLELLISSLTWAFPNDAKAEGALKSFIAFLARLQSAPILQGASLNPRPGAPSHPTVMSPVAPAKDPAAK